MTAEIVIINQQAVALAADSAITIGKQRVWKHANKIFSAGPHHDIGMMIYNSGDFLSIPWEVIIKEFRKKTSVEKYSKISDFVSAFMDYVKRDEFGSDDFEELSFAFICTDIIDGVFKIINYETKSQFLKDIAAEVNRQLDELSNVRELPCPFSYEVFESNFAKLIRDLVKSTSKRKIHRNIINKIILLCFEHIKRESHSEYSTGIVIAGYGRSELFPSAKNIIVDGRWNGFTRVWTSEPSVDLNKTRSQNAAIIPFAQVDMAKLFMEGISDRYVDFMTSTLAISLHEKVEEVLNNMVADPEIRVVEQTLQTKQIAAMLKIFTSEFARFRNEYFTKPILDTIQALPKEEMAYMARAMVEITALRRRFASSVETVGGDIDVAVISKSDGFIWIHRKNYFDIDSNPDFMQRRQMARGV